MNLIITPVFKNFYVTKQCCDAIDSCSSMPYLHILVDDNSGFNVPVKIDKKRRVIRVFSDTAGREHKNQLGQMIDLGYWYGTQKYCNEIENDKVDNIFIIESDVVVRPGWDREMLQEAKRLSKKWFTLDASSVDENGDITYPDTVAPRWSMNKEGFDHLHYAMFQCTLINKDLVDLSKKRISDIPSHFDILWSRSLSKQEKGFYRTNMVKVLHINGGGSSRRLL